MRVLAATGELVEPIERANLRIIHRLGVGEDGRPSVADPACAERSRVMRLAGSINGKTGAYARIVEADFALAPYPIAQLVGDLPDPATHTSPRPQAPGQEHRPVQADQPARVLREARRDRRPARRARVLPCARSRRSQPVVLGRNQPGDRVVLSLGVLRGARRDLRPRVGAARRAVGPRAARRGVQPRPRVRRRRVRRAGQKPTTGRRSTGPVKGADDDSEQRRAGGHDRAARDTQDRPAVHACGAGRALTARGQARAAAAQAGGSAGRGRAHRSRRGLGRRAARAARTAARRQRQRTRGARGGQQPGGRARRRRFGTRRGT